MGEILRDWIQARLGALIDLKPDVFGHYTRDGTLLAQILHSYDIITRDQLDTIVPTQDPALCRVNLKHLRFWLRFVGADCDDESIEEISRGRGSASLRLFYKLYLSLETKDRLHFITLQKERERFVPTSKKFEVTKVSEDPPPYQPEEHRSSKKLAKGKDTLDWHRSKYPRMLRKLQRQRKQLDDTTEPSRVRHLLERCVPEVPERTSLDDRKKQSEELDRFELKHRVRAKEKEEEEEEEEEEEKETDGTYVDRLKDRRKRAATIDALKSKMRKALLSELWERMAAKQERAFDEAIASRVLDQSRYEKQIVTKLCEVREQKNTMAGNQKVVEDITLEATAVEHRASYERAQDLVVQREKDVEAECRRMCELRERLLAEKIEKIRKKHWKFCQGLLVDLVSIALNMAEHRRVNDGRVPVALLTEWKSMFLKSLPIFDEEIPYDDHDDDHDDDRDGLLKTDSSDALETLREALLDDYLDGNPPWERLEESSSESFESGRAILGYAVHRLLEGLYARPIDRSRTLLSELKHVAIVLGVGNRGAYETLRALLDHASVRALRMEDAINYCLEWYKHEMSDIRYIDLNVIAATTDAIRQKVDSNRVDRRMDESIKEIGDNGEGRNDDTREKETQTPRNIPYDDVDPVLSDSAYIGKWAYEFLTLGEPITDELATKILLEYLKSATRANGCVLIDYPDTYERMSRLEAALTGSAPPPEPNSADLRDVTIEEIESIEPRIVFEDKSDPYAANRRSRLVPDPIAKRGQPSPSSSRTFATVFVRTKRRPKHLENEDQTYELVEEDAPSIDRFYASREIARVLYYSALDLPTLKTLARLAMGDLARGKPSTELFGEALTNLTEEQETKRYGQPLKPAIVRRLVTENIEFDHEIESEESYDRLVPTVGKSSGESTWRWIDFPLPSTLVKSLASIWDRMEKRYTEQLKELLLLKSVHSSSVAPYVDLVTRNARDYVERPDQRQELLRRFHAAFNAIEHDARNDADVKCELHRRVADFRGELWEICDRKRREVEAERKRLIDEQWPVCQAVLLFNVYVGLVQAEMDRCVDTIRVLHDYYLGMAGKPLLEIDDSSKVILGRIETDEPLKSTDIADSRPAAVDRDALQKEIEHALTDKNATLGDVEEVSLFKGIVETVNYARSIVDAVSTGANELLRREEIAIVNVNDLEMVSRMQDLTLEWRYAVEYEIERVRLKLESIANVARSDVGFLMETLENTFHGIYDSIVDRYWREMKSVNETANAFCFAIEEGTPIEKEMLLEGDRLIVRSHVYVCETERWAKSRSAKEIPSSSVRFRIVHLARLMETFKRIAPYGTMCERTLIYVIEDLIGHGQEEGETISLPCSWYRLRSTDVSDLVDRLFGPVDYVDWREFLVYAMDLPMPTCRDILIARDRFRIQDPDLKETVTRAQYHWTPMWFLECTKDCPNVGELLRDELIRNQEEFYEEEFYQFEGEATNIRSAISNVTPCYSSPEETLRRALAKELLCRMYMVDRYTVNYTALLLAFCKGEDPRDGFGKALALALGNRVCADIEEGERYVQQLLRGNLRDSKMPRVATTVTESVAEIEGELSTSESSERRAEDREGLVYWLPLELCLTVLTAALPWDALRPEVLERGGNLRENLASVYQELTDPDLNERTDTVLAHRLLNHWFVIRLLNSVTKFTVKNVGSIVEEILRRTSNN
ncbi:sperm flagellar protein 2 [Xylocopa sonorina]|uniref:sperm flagellar protein 2 n=1 Tax=Xylocopa sonorina TaxID=1818115 RepID=UPI00403ABF28